MPQSRRLKPGLTAAAWRPFIWAVNGPAARLACVVCRASPGRPGRGGVGGGTAKVGRGACGAASLRHHMSSR